MVLLPDPCIARLRTLAAAGGSIDSVRLLHGRGLCYPGLSFVALDFFQPVLLVTLFAAPPDGWLAALEAQLKPLLPEPVAAVVVQHRYQHGAPSVTLLGEVPEVLYARRGPLRFTLNPLAQQNIGFFLDMEPGRQWLASLAVGKRVLNLFAYTCAFSVVAIAAGAELVVNVDMSKRALGQGRDNHHLNGLDKNRSLFLPEQILKSWSRIKKRGPYDVVIFDPPSYQPGSFVATRDYAKLVRRIPELMPAGGDILACLNAPELPPDFVQTVFASECPAAQFCQRLAPSTDFPDTNPTQQLKLLHFRYPGVADDTATDGVK
ncbi:MAG TPA: class I SAM-dependent methyltransferase [Cellvibrionaceae bacterium]